MVVRTFRKVIAVAMLGLTYVIAMPLVSVGVYGDSAVSGKAFADKRDIGHLKHDKGKQDSKTGATGTPDEN